MIDYQFLIENPKFLNWQEMIANYQLFPNWKELFREYHDFVNWKKALDSNKFSEEFLIEFEEFVGFSKILYTQKLSEKYLQHKLDTTTVSRREFHIILKTQTLSEQFIEHNFGRLNQFSFELLAEHQDLPESFWEKHTNNYSQKIWNILVDKQNLSEQFLLRNHQNFFWCDVSIKNLTRNLMRQFKEELDWYHLSDQLVEHNVALDTSFLQEFVDYLDWNEISLSEQISVADLILFRDQVNWASVCCQNLTEDKINQLAPYLTRWDLIFSDNSISENCALRHMSSWAKRLEISQVLRTAKQNKWNKQRIQEAYDMYQLLSE